MKFLNANINYIFEQQSSLKSITISSVTL